MACTGRWSQLRLLMWKNWQLRKAHPFYFLMTILLSIGFQVLIAYAAKEYTSKNTKEYSFPSNELPPTGEESESFLMFSPKNEILNEIVAKASELLGYVKPENYTKLEEIDRDDLEQNDLMAFIEFDESLANIKKYPKKLSFSLRVPVIDTWKTSQRFPKRMPYGWQPAPNVYETSLFLSIQHAVSMAFIKLRNQSMQVPVVNIQAMPLRRQKIHQIHFLTNILLYNVYITFILHIVSSMRHIIDEKEQRLKVILKINGLSNNLQWLAWFLDLFIKITFLSVLTTLLLTVVANERAIFALSSITLVFTFLITFSFMSICFNMMYTTFFSRSGPAMMLYSILYVLSNALPMIVYIYDLVDRNLTGQLILCIFILPALDFGFKLIHQFEFSGIGLQWSDLFTTATPDEPLSMGILLITMFLYSILFLLICFYVQLIWPGEYDLARKWYYPFTIAFWIRPKSSIERNARVGDTPDVVTEFTSNGNFEEEPKNKIAGIRIKQLRKVFGKTVAVKDLTINLYKDQISVLLGHNGAGKTTTISMLVGMIPATSGTVIINGYDITTNRENARISMGICPQHNILFDDLTASSHLEFFARLKGLSGPTLEWEIAKYLKILNLEEKAHYRTGTLSGGMKRKLSVCCAMCGGTRVVFCDEPSAGLDPTARRELWDLLLSEKEGRTILLTTHYMEEADILGDRIAIMADGELKCVGTSIFLKKKYGSGYRLVCIKGEGCDIKLLTTLLSKYIPGITPINNVGAEVTYSLPYGTTTVFGAMLQDLENNSVALNITGFGLNNTSLEEVFIKASVSDTTSNQSSMNKTIEQFWSDYKNMPKPNAFVWIIKQFIALSLKNILFYYHNFGALLLQFTTPILIATTPLLFALLGEQTTLTQLPSIQFDLNDYKRMTMLVASRAKANTIVESIVTKYTNLYTKSTDSNMHDIQIIHKTIPKFVMSTNISTRVFDLFYMGGLSAKSKEFTVWFNSQMYHSAPLSLNLLHNAMAKIFIGNDSEIVVSNNPLPKYINDPMSFRQANPDDRQTLLLRSVLDIATKPYHTYLSLLIASIFLVNFYILLPIVERISRAKLLLFISGTRLWAYWVNQLLWDILTCTICLMIIGSIWFSVTLVRFGNHVLLRHYFGILVIFCFSKIPYLYLISKLFSNPSNGFIRSFFISMLLMFAGSLMSITNTLICILPDVALIRVTMRTSPYVISHSIMCGSDILKMLPREKLCQKFPACCGVQFPFWQSSASGVLPECAYMISSGFIAMILIISSEYGIFKIIKTHILALLWKDEKLIITEEDVMRERDRVKQLTEMTSVSSTLIVDDLAKHYRRFHAVNSVSFAINKAECFGLLGNNGAGKTSLFKMFTGEEVITNGNCFICGTNIKHLMVKAYNYIGYCPQFDALIPFLTIRQTLRIFCIMHGIPNKQIVDFSRGIANSFGFSKHLDRRVEILSGGNKRKLSTAIAVIGNPSLIFMDEPTAGIDPAARRLLWDMIYRMREAGKTVVLSSHSMEECEALCTRLTIMIHGSLKCLGSIQHLKNKYSKGVILKIHMRAPMAHEKQSEMITNIKEFVKAHFPGGKLSEEYADHITFYLPLIRLKWSDIFEMMENHRTALPIEDYIIRQTTLEEIFLYFAKKNERDDD